MTIFTIIKSLLSGAISNLLSLFARYWRILVPVLIVLLVFWYIHALRSQRDDAVNALASFKSKQAMIVAKQLSANSIELAKRDQITSNVVTAYSNSVKSLKDYYANHPNIKLATSTVSLPVTSNDSSTMPAESKGTSNANASTEGTGTGANEVTALDCANDVLTLLSLQKWEREQDLVN